MTQMLNLERLFSLHPELRYLTGLILLLTIAVFAYLIYQYLNKRSQKQNGHGQGNFIAGTGDAASKNPPFQTAGPLQTIGGSYAPPSEVQMRPAQYADNFSRDAYPVQTTPYEPISDLTEIELAPREFQEAPEQTLQELISVQETKSPDVIMPPITHETMAVEADFSQVSARQVQSLPIRTDKWKRYALQRRVELAKTRRRQKAPFSVTGVEYIGYKPNANWQHLRPGNYPYVIMPQTGSPVRLPIKGGNIVPGFAAEKFQRMLAQTFKGCQISGEDCIPVSNGGGAVVPDITIIIREGGLNLFAAIKIDEPYSAHMRTPQNLVGENDLRDVWLSDRGWLVIHFSERQVVAEAARCMALIGKIIRSIHPNFEVPSALESFSPPGLERQWTLAQAQHWQSLHYREAYLGIKAFERVALPEQAASFSLTFQDSATELQVKSSFPQESILLSGHPANLQHIHARDIRIRIIPGIGQYTVDGFPVKMLSSLIDSYFPEPQADGAKNQDDLSLTKMSSAVGAVGTYGFEEDKLADLQLRKAVEGFYSKKGPEPIPGFSAFLNFEQVNQKVTVYRTGWPIFDEQLHIMGVADMVVRQTGGNFDLYAWTCSENVLDFMDRPITKNPDEITATGAFLHLQYTYFNRCALEQNVLRLLLEKRYGLQIDNMYLVVFQSGTHGIAKVKLPLMLPEAELLVSEPY